MLKQNANIKNIFLMFIDCIRGQQSCIHLTNIQRTFSTFVMLPAIHSTNIQRTFAMFVMFTGIQSKNIQMGVEYSYTNKSDVQNFVCLAFTIYFQFCIYEWFEHIVNKHSKNISNDCNVFKHTFNKYSNNIQQIFTMFLMLFGILS